MLGEGIRDISDNSDLGPKTSPVCKEREAYTGVFIILSNLLLSHAVSERITCTQLLPGNCRDNTCRVGSLKKKILDFESKRSRLVLWFWGSCTTELQCLEYTARHQRGVSQLLRPGTEARGSPESAELPWRAGAEAFPVSTHSCIVVGRGHSTGTPQSV